MYTSWHIIKFGRRRERERGREKGKVYEKKRKWYEEMALAMFVSSI